MLSNGTGGTTNNALPPSVSNFFAVNSNLLNQAVKPSAGGGAGGGAFSFTPQFDYNAGGGTSIVAGVVITNLNNMGNLFNSSNSYVAKTNFASAVVVTNRLTFPEFGEQIGDDGSGNLSIFTPFGDVNIGGSGFGAIDGTLNANLINAVVPITDLNNGTGATSSTFWRGDGSWAVPAGGTTIASNLIDGPIPINIATDVTTNTNCFPYVAGFSPIAVIDGDSLSVGDGSGSGGFIGVSNYFTLMTNLYGFKFVTVHNTSVGGKTAGSISTNYPSEIGAYAPGAGTNAALFIWAGINDIASAFSAEQTYGWLTNIYYHAHTNGFKVVAFTVTYSLVNQTELSYGETARLNAMIRNSPTNWDYLVDAAAVLPPPTVGTSLWFCDGVHYTNYGQQFLAYNVFNTLQRGQHLQGTKYEQPYLYPALYNLFTNTLTQGSMVSYVNPHYLATNSSTFVQSYNQGGNTYFEVQNQSAAGNGMTWIGPLNSDANEYAFLMQPGTGWTASSYYHQNAAELQIGPDDTVGLDFLLVGGVGGYQFYMSGPLSAPGWEIEPHYCSTTNVIIATNGFSSRNTNILTVTPGTSWSGQLSTINNGFTNTYGTNCTVNINGSAGYFVFYHSGGAGASTACANPLFTNALSTNGWSRSLPHNCGVQVFASGGNANVTVDFGQ
jgi:hypothetical protein